MEELAEVVVDRKVLDSFKRRALKVYPQEIFEQVVGRISGPQARIFAFRDLEHVAKNGNVYTDDDMNPMTEGEDESRFEILGTIHTHPQDTVEPSDLDWETMQKDGELVMGICSIRKTAKRRFVSFAFYSSSKVHLQLTISEENTSATG
ncbi:MAG: Mov34/MPN/PAD-1 family protein [Acidobacteriia bacterium]|jgi:proteasome lid subunit RPN8/RPN11|nr:Mov34/MPN/PAD-1 family protein [Terriglobia bacterium]